MKPVRRGRMFAGMSCALVVVVLGSPLMGQGTLLYSDQQARADAHYIRTAGPVGNFGVQQSFDGSDFYRFEDRAFAGSGFSGRGYAEHGATFLPSSPMIHGQFMGVIMDACTSAEVFQSNIGVNSYERAYGLASGVIEFSIHAPMVWNLAGSTRGSSFNTGANNIVNGAVELVDMITGVALFSQVDSTINGVGDWVTFFNAGGVLPTGSYRLSWSHESIVEGGLTGSGFFGTAAGGAPIVVCMNSVFTLTPAPGGLALIGVVGLIPRRRGSPC